MGAKLSCIIAFFLCLKCYPLFSATALDTNGITLLRSLDPTLTGSGIRVAHPEAQGTNNDWEVNPNGVGQPASLFTWRSSSGTATNFPNLIGNESGHADAVGYNFYSPSGGIAPGIAHIDNYDADYFTTNYIMLGIAIPSAQIVNQSFIYFPVTVPQQITLDSVFDDYVDDYGYIICSGIGNGGQVYPPATAYNVIGVGAYGGDSSTGPTLDNGRSKPDIVAPASATSFSTPYVSGAAAILLQAAARGDGGTNTAPAASDVRTVKALLLNGAIKPTNWTHTSSAPLDARYGAGVLNVFNSYNQLAGGRHEPMASTFTSGIHPPIQSSVFVTSLVGWDFRTVTNSFSVKHYCFKIPQAWGSAQGYTLTSTLVWNRHSGETNINDLDLFLYDMSNSNLVASSTSPVDNVEQIYLRSLPPGEYDLQVLKNIGTKSLTTIETYALAFEIFSMALQINRQDNNVALSWPIAPTGFTLQSAINLSSPIIWNTVTNTALVTGNSNQITLTASNFASFYRLIR